jgi:putative Holliday junction resolvase
MTKRIMALDVGERRIGVAVTDALAITAQPLETIERRGDKAAVARIVEIADSYQVGEIVVGIPYGAQGQLTQQAQRIAHFADLIAARAAAPVVRHDERHTTATAERVLLQADANRAKRRLVRDKMAAAVLLQDYLQARRRRAPDVSEPTESRVIGDEQT